jgi:hypothetical protein
MIKGEAWSSEWDLVRQGCDDEEWRHGVLCQNFTNYSKKDIPSIFRVEGEAG